MTKTFSSNIEQDIDPQFKHLIGKRIMFYSGKKSVAGEAGFIGINPLHNQFQVTIDRCPFWPIDKNTIREITPETNIYEKQAEK